MGKLFLVSVNPAEWELEGSTGSCREADTAVPAIRLRIRRAGWPSYVLRWFGDRQQGLRSGYTWKVIIVEYVSYQDIRFCCFSTKGITDQHLAP